MSEVPKKIWYNFEWGREIVRGMDEDDIQYIRSDLVDELVNALNLALPYLLKDTSSHGKANYWTAKAALAKLEESHE